MRHLVKGRKLGRTASHRKATLMALSVALIKSERIVTTLAKAKALRSYVEPIITRSKEDSTHNRSHVFRYLRDKQATSRLFDEIAPMVADRPGGYTRIIKLGVRPGDGVEKAMIELVDFNEAKADTPGKKKRRTRRGGAGKKASEKPAEAKKEASKKKADKDAVPKEKAAAAAKDGDKAKADEKAEAEVKKAEEAAEKKEAAEEKKAAKEEAAEKKEAAAKPDKTAEKEKSDSGESEEEKK